VKTKTKTFRNLPEHVRALGGEDGGLGNDSREVVQADEKPISGDEDVLWVPEHDGYRALGGRRRRIQQRLA
jgi:hypothetical protein